MTERILKSDSAKVHFPCIHSGGGGDILSVSCFLSDDLKGIVKVVSGIDDESARRVIGPSRYGERNFRAGNGVMVLFSNPLFTGKSYGLALAVADKIARYGKMPGTWSTIYATGEINADGCGKVTAVDGFDAKLDLLRAKGVPDGVLLYPEHCLTTSKHEKENLSRFFEGGVECIGIQHISELEGLLWEESLSDNRIKQYMKSARDMIQHPTVRKCGQGLLALIGVIFVMFIFKGEPDTEETARRDNTWKADSSEISKEIEISHQDIAQKASSEAGTVEQSVKLELSPTLREQPKKQSQTGEQILESVEVDTNPF